MTGDISDKSFAERAFAQLPKVEPSPRLEASLLAAYDAWNRKRAAGRWSALKAGFGRVFDIVWPGAPPWVPASALAASLLLGAGAGATLPAMVDVEVPGFSLEHTGGFSLLSADGPAEDS